MKFGSIWALLLKKTKQMFLLGEAHGASRLHNSCVSAARAEGVPARRRWGRGSGVRTGWNRNKINHHRGADYTDAAYWAEFAPSSSLLPASNLLPIPPPQPPHPASNLVTAVGVTSYNIFSTPLFHFLFFPRMSLCLAVAYVLNRAETRGRRETRSSEGGFSVDHLSGDLEAK